MLLFLSVSQNTKGITPEGLSFLTKSRRAAELTTYAIEMYIIRYRGSFNNYVDKSRVRGLAKIPHLSIQGNIVIGGFCPLFVHVDMRGYVKYP